VRIAMARGAWPFWTRAVRKSGKWCAKSHTVVQHGECSKLFYLARTAGIEDGLSDAQRFEAAA